MYRHVLPRGASAALHVGAAGVAVGAVRGGGGAAAVHLLRYVLERCCQLAGKHNATFYFILNRFKYS